GRAFAGEDIVIVGDTPVDVACGRPIGARAVAVATGFYDVAALRATGATHVFATLADTAAVLDAIFAGASPRPATSWRSKPVWRTARRCGKPWAGPAR